MDTNINKPGRPDILEDQERLNAALLGVHGAEGYERPSRFLMLKLASAGYVSRGESAPTGRRGRPAYVFTLTPRGCEQIGVEYI